MSVTVVVQESAANEIRDASPGMSANGSPGVTGSRTRLFKPSVELKIIRHYSDVSTRMYAELPCTGSPTACSTGYRVIP